MAAPKENVGHISTKYVETSCEAAMRCSECDGMSDLERFFFFDKLKTHRHRRNLLTRCLCEYHCSSKWQFYLWSKIIEAENPDKADFLKMMFALGKSSVDLSAFNLYVGCMSQWDFFETCRVPQTLPEFASQTMLSRPCKTSTVSWEKTMLKLHEAFEVETLSGEALLRGMLACRVLILIEVTEKTPVLRMTERGRQLLCQVLPCNLVTNSKVWPASGLCFYPIFRWIQHKGYISQAEQQFIQKHETTLNQIGHRFASVTVSSPNSITIDLEPLDGSYDHTRTIISTFDLERNSFPVTVENGRGTKDSLFLSMTPMLGQIMLILKMTYAYLDNNNNGDLHRELLIACLLCVLKSGVKQMNSLKLHMLNQDYEENMKQVQKTKPGTVRPPLIACDYRTSAGQRRRERGDQMKICFPSEKQTIKTFVANLRRCEGLHSTRPKRPKRPESLFKDACDEVVETLSRSKFENFDIVMSSVPKQMAQMASLPSPSPEPSTSGNVRTKRKRIIDSDDEGDDVIEVTPTRELARKPKVPKRRRDIDSGDDIETESVALSQPRMEHIIRPPVTIPVAAVAGARKEQIVLESKKPAESPSESGHEDAQNDDDDDDGDDDDDNDDDDNDDDDDDDDDDDNDDDDDYKGDQDGSESDDDSGGEEGEKRRYSSPLNTPMTDTSAIQLANSNETGTKTSTSETTRPVAPPLTIQLTVDQCDVTLDGATISQTVEQVVAKEGPMASSMIEKDTPMFPVPPLTLRSTQSADHPVVDDSVSDLFNGELCNNIGLDDDDDYDVTHADKSLYLGSPQGPIASELISRGQSVQGPGTMTVGPMNYDTAMRGKCLVRLLREVGELTEVVPEVKVVSTSNGEFAFKIYTDLDKLYTLGTYPLDWIQLKNCAQIGRTIFMVAALQSLDSSDLSKFEISADNKLAWFPPVKGRLETEIHPLEVLQSSSLLGHQLRKTVRQDENFGAWAKAITEKKRPLVESIVRQSNLATRDLGKTIDLDYFGRFFQKLSNALPWIDQY